MLIAEIANRTELSAVITSELRESYGIKYRREKNHHHQKVLQVCFWQFLLIFKSNEIYKLKNIFFLFVDVWNDRMLELKFFLFQANKVNHGKIFNTHLAQLQLTDVVLTNGGITQIPVFVSDACQCILEQVTTEGLFRKAGSAARQREIKVIQTSNVYASIQFIRLWMCVQKLPEQNTLTLTMIWLKLWQSCKRHFNQKFWHRVLTIIFIPFQAHLDSGLRLEKNHHVIDVANVLKLFFRELPEPLLPPGNTQETILRSLLNKSNEVEVLMLTCLLLPPLSLNILMFFMQFLHTISMHSDANKMTIENLAIIFAPGLMPLTEMIGQRLNCHVKIIEMLIRNSNRIGMVPKSILDKMNHSAPIADDQNTDVVDKKKKKRRSGSLTSK